jgi:F420-0:gamma-glutamyl ligase
MRFSSLKAQALTTRIFRLGENLLEFIVDAVSRELVKESVVLAVTSKIVSLAENRVLNKSEISKEQLIEREADYNLGEVGYGCYLTVKHGLFIPSAGIDESNSELGQYILYPEDPFRSARQLQEGLRARWQLRELGVLIVDSHTTPLRRGVTGISLAHWGFRGLKDKIGSYDLFGRKIQVTTVNIADALAAAAVLTMGETNESRPLAVLKCDGLEFSDPTDTDELKMPIEEDLYYPFFKQHLLKK